MRQTMSRSEIEELFSEDSGVRSAAARKLGVRDVDLLESEDYLAAVAGRLASADGEAALPALQRLLGHPDGLVRANAACSIAVLEPDQGVPILEMLLFENDREVRRRVLETLCRIRPPGVGRLLSRILFTLYQARFSIDPFDDWTRDLRRRMVVALGIERESYAVNSLRQALCEGDPQVRASAAWALGEIGDPVAVPDLVDTLDDRDGTVRQRAVEALGKLPDRSACDALLRRLDDPEPKVAAAAARCLGSFREPRVAPELLRIIAGDSDRVARAAFRALRILGHGISVPELTDKIASPNVDVQRRANAADLLGLTGDGEALPALLTALGHRENLVSVAAARALGRLGDHRAASYLRDVLEDDDQPTAVLQAVLGALGELGDSMGLYAVRLASESPDQNLANTAYRTMVRLGYAKVVPEKRAEFLNADRTRAPRLLMRAGRFDERL